MIKVIPTQRAVLDDSGAQPPRDQAATEPDIERGGIVIVHGRSNRRLDDAGNPRINLASVFPLSKWRSVLDRVEAPKRTSDEMLHGTKWTITPKVPRPATRSRSNRNTSAHTSPSGSITSSPMPSR